MDNTAAEVCTLLGVVESLLTAMAESGLELSPQVCANAIYGLQNCSIADESTRSIMYIIVNRLKELLAAQNEAPAVKQGPFGKFSNLLAIHQALSLVVPMQPDLEIDAELQEELLNLQATFAQLVDDRTEEFKSVPLCPTETRLLEGLTDMFEREPFEVCSGVLIHGFVAGIVIRLKEGVVLHTTSGELWNPILVIEPFGGANESFPRRQLFTRLKHDFFKHAHQIAVQTVPVTILIGKGKSLLRERLLEIPDLFLALYPPTEKDSALFTTTLQARGLCGPNGLLSSLHAHSDITDSRMSPMSTSGLSGVTSGEAAAAASSSFFSGGTPNAFAAGTNNANEPCDGSLEYCLDFHEASPFTGAQRSMLLSLSASSIQQGMALRWIGELPVVKPSSPQPHARSSPVPRPSPSLVPTAGGISINTLAVGGEREPGNPGTKFPATLSAPPGHGAVLSTGSAYTSHPTNSTPRPAPLRSLQPPKIGFTPHMAFSVFQRMNQPGPGEGAGAGRHPLATPSPSTSSTNVTVSSANTAGSSPSSDVFHTTTIAQPLIRSPLTDSNTTITTTHMSAVIAPPSVSEKSVPVDITLNAAAITGTSSQSVDSAVSSVDKEIEELEAELEIARLEAKLLKLRNAKQKSSGSSGSVISVLADEMNSSDTTTLETDGK